MSVLTGIDGLAPGRGTRRPAGQLYAARRAPGQSEEAGSERGAKAEDEEGAQACMAVMDWEGRALHDSVSVHAVWTGPTHPSDKPRRGTFRPRDLGGVRRRGRLSLFAGFLVLRRVAAVARASGSLPSRLGVAAVLPREIATARPTLLRGALRALDGEDADPHKGGEGVRSRVGIEGPPACSRCRPRSCGALGLDGHRRPSTFPWRSPPCTPADRCLARARSKIGTRR